MTTMTKQELEATIQAIREVGARVRRDPDFRREFFRLVDKRVLTDQPAETPKQRSERLLRQA